VIAPHETATVDHVSAKKKDGVQVECLKLSIRGAASHVKKSELCVQEDSHLLVRQTSVFEDDVAEFKDYAAFAGKQYPRTQLLSESGHVVVEAHVENLDPLVPDDTGFAGLSGVQPWITCDDGNPPQVINAPDPEYTENARSQKVEGSNLLWMEVFEDGSVANPRVLRPLEPSLDQAALARVKQWRFRPATWDGRPVPTEINVSVNFRMY
jgi:TonB family protein